MKQTEMLVVSLRGINFAFWSRLGCSGQSANILSCQVPFTFYSNQKFWFTYMNILHQSIPAVHIPPGQPRGICSNVSPGGGALAILSQPGGWALAWLLIQRSVNNQVLKKKISQLCVSKTMIIVFFKHCERDCRYFSQNIQNKWLL